MSIFTFLAAWFGLSIVTTLAFCIARTIQKGRDK
jgi:hypothetical protein